MWNVEDSKLEAELSDTVFVTRAAFSPDGRWLATVGGDSSIRLWETSGWQKTRTLRGHTDPVTSLAFSPNGRYLATGARNGEVKLWSMEEPRTAPEPVSFPTPEFFEVASDGSGFGRIQRPEKTDGVATPWTAELWTARPLQRKFAFPLPEGEPENLIVLSGCRGLLVGCTNGSLRVVGPDLGSESVRVQAHRHAVYVMDVSMDGSTLVTKGVGDDTILLWRLPRLERIAELPRFTHVHDLKLSNDGRWLAAFTGPGDLGVWEIPSMKGPPMWHGLPAIQGVMAAAFSADDRSLATAVRDGGLFLWDLSTQRRKVLPRALTVYHSLSFSPDGSRLAAGAEGESRLFDTATGQVVLSFKQPGLKLAFARDGESLLSVHGEGASVLLAPSLDKLRFDWLKERPSEEIQPYLGPEPEYTRPDRP